MKILAIDTSSKICSVAILEDEKKIIELYNDDEKTHSVKLMPMIEKAFSVTNLSLNDISLLVCSIGPGSFTGVRIGIATIKAFADAKNIPVVGISSLESLAYNITNENTNALVCSLIDAKHDNVYCGVYSFSDNCCNQLAMFSDEINDCISKIQNILKNSNYNKIKFVGDGSYIYHDLLSASFNNITFSSTDENSQKSISFAKAGYIKFKNNCYNDFSLSPIYLKKSQAERTLEEKISIEKMSINDIENISSNYESQFDKFWNINNLKNDFNNPNSSYYIAKLDNEIVGFAGILKICDEANIMNIVAKISKRNLGIGTKLLNQLIISAKELNCNSITLEVNENNYPAIHLYEKFGFKRIGLRKKYYNNDNAIIMSITF